MGDPSGKAGGAGAQASMAAAQSVSVRGELEANVAEHLVLIRAAAAAGADLVLFPELSLTGYELELAASLQLDPEDERLEPLRRAAHEHGVTVVAGAPCRGVGRLPYLAALRISPAGVHWYAKMHLHVTEAPFFAPGSSPCTATIGGIRTALAICADASQPPHAEQAARSGAELYAVGVMKTAEEYPGFAARLAGYAIVHNMAVLMANHGAPSGGDTTAGGSALWDSCGTLLARAPANGRALVVGRRSSGGWSGEVIRDL